MRALQFHEFGDPSKLSLGDWPDPLGDEATAVVRIVAASVNPSDVKNVAGQMEGTLLPRVPGRDFSGVVERGPAEWVGAEVWGTGGEIGFSADGTHAERIAFPIHALVRKPHNLGHSAAAAVGVNFIIAWLGAVLYAEARAGETMAVVGAGGGVGGAVIQIAKARGCRVIGVDRQPPPPDSPAGQLIDAFFLSTGDFAADVKRLTRGRGADVVFDAVGGVLFEPSVSALGHRGRLVEISATGKRRVEFDAIDFYHKEGRIFGADSRKVDTIGSAKILASLVLGFETGQYRAPHVAGTYRLADGVAAYRAVASGTPGRVVLEV
ncbi:MAG: zinc-binding alcohol dehydrogenase family protein [Polyangiaceae bacterium]|jgi:NADPH:quinone reductase-like Zn-dependent oxidoreductase